MNMVEKTGKTVEDAVKAALAVLGVSRDQVDVEVLEESKSSILGLFGGRDAKVRVTVKEVPAEEPSVPEPVAEIPEEKPEPAKGEVPEEPVQETKAPADRDAERQAVAAAAKTFLEEVFRAMGMDLLIEKFISRKDEEIILKIRHRCPDRKTRPDPGCPPVPDQSGREQGPQKLAPDHPRCGELPGTPAGNPGTAGQKSGGPGETDPEEGHAGTHESL